MKQSAWRTQLLISLTVLAVSCGACSGTSPSPAVDPALAQCVAERDNLQRELNERQVLDDTPFQPHPFLIEVRALEGSLDEKIDQIVDELPYNVRAQVEAELRAMRETVLTEVKKLDSANDEMNSQLKATTERLDRIRQDLGIRDEHQQQILDLSNGVASLIRQVESFDRDRLSCRKCPGSISLKEINRMEITDFHRGMVEQMDELRRASQAIALLATESIDTGGEDE